MKVIQTFNAQPVKDLDRCDLKKLQADFSFKRLCKDCFDSHCRKNETVAAGINTS